MNVTVQRRPTVKQTTFGVLSIDGAFQCYTLEDVIREQPGVPVEQWKVKKETAIPAGRYRLSLVNSPHFGPDTLTVNDVPGFQYIRIHAGNDDADTEGCLLVGTRIVEQDDDGGNILNSRKALRALKSVLVPAIKKGASVWLEVINP